MPTMLHPLIFQSPNEPASNPDAFSMIILIGGLALFGWILYMVVKDAGRGTIQPQARAEKFCNDCGFGMNAAEDFCPRCGYPTDAAYEDQRLCTNCNTINDVDANFCQGCGDSI